MSNPKKKSKRSANRSAKSRQNRKGYSDPRLKHTRYAKIYIDVEECCQKHGCEGIEYQYLFPNAADPDTIDFSEYPHSDILENQQDYSIHSETTIGEQMTASKTKKEKAPEQTKKETKPVAAPGTDQKAEMEFLEETADFGGQIYKDIADMSPELVDATKPEVKAESKKKEEKPAPEKKASSPASDVPAPGIDEKDEMAFLKDTGDFGGDIFQAIAEMGNQKIDTFVNASGSTGCTPTLSSVATAKKPVVPSPGVDVAAEFAFIEQTTKYGAKIDAAVAAMSPEISAKPEKEEKKETAKKTAEPAKEEKKAEKAEPEQKVVAAPGMNEADEMDFLEKTADFGGAIYQAIAEMKTADMSKVKTTKVKGKYSSVSAKPAVKVKETDMSKVKTTKVEGKYSSVSEKPAEKTADMSKVKTTKAEGKYSSLPKKASKDVKVSKTEGAYSHVSEKPAKKTQVNLTDEALNQYRTFANDTLMEMAQALGIEKDLGTLTNEIVGARSLEDYTEDLILEAFSKNNGIVFEEDGFDESLIPVLVKRIADTLPFKVSDMTDLSNDIKESLTMYLGDDAMANADLYHRLFDQVRSILMRGQKQNATTLAELQIDDDADLRQLIEHFMNVAYDLLPYWQYDDVKFYEGFIYAVLSQFADLEDLHNRAMMDVADLYIKHGDYGRGDADYNYLIRENNLKDQIFYRFANVYRPIDFQKAKNIAGGALQFVDDRYSYYPRIIEILES